MCKSFHCPEKEKCLAIWRLDYYHSTPKELYHQQYFECLDLNTAAIRERFEQPGYAVVLKLESLLLKAAQKEYSEELQFVLKHYHNDFDASRLEAQLELLGVMFSSTEKLNPTLDVVKNQVSTFSPVQRASLSEI